MTDFEEAPESFISKWWGIILALVLLTLVVFVYYYRWQVNQETLTTRQSIGYISSHQSALRMLATQYVDPSLSVAQHRALYQQLRLEADLIPRDIPNDIQRLLDRGP